MKIAIHPTNSSFSSNWIAYCEKKGIPYKIVNCYSIHIISDLDDCDALMWHHSQNNPKDLVIAKQLLFALQHSGKIVFPDFKTQWHFDDKLAQKYLLEAIDAPLVKSFSFFDKTSADKWLQETKYPVVFKLRGGAGSFNVKLIKSYSEGRAIIKKAFGSGFTNFDVYANLKEVFRKWRLGIASQKDVLKAAARFFIKPAFSKVMGKEFGYAYFQQFIPLNSFDIRVICIDGKAFAIKRMVRENDFRASGSGFIKYGKEEFDIDTIALAHDLARKLDSQCVAFDFIYLDGKPLVVEISYGYFHEAYNDCPGYWDESLHFHEQQFDSCEWMVDLVVKKISEKSNKVQS